MCFFRKEKVADKTKYDRDLIEANSRAVEALIVLAKEKMATVEALKTVQEKIKYLKPSNDTKVIHYDEVIKNKIGDLRIVLTKSDKTVKCEHETLSKVEFEIGREAEKLLTDIKLAIADRNTRL